MVGSGLLAVADGDQAIQLGARLLGGGGGLLLKSELALQVREVLGLLRARRGLAVQELVEESLCEVEPRGDLGGDPPLLRQ